MIALLLAATLYTTTEKDGWTEGSVDPVDAIRDTPALFETDGKTPRAGSDTLPPLSLVIYRTK